MQDEDLGEGMPMAKTSAKASVKALTPVKAPKKTFGHHSGKPGLPFCTMESMGQVSNSLLLSLNLGLYGCSLAPRRSCDRRAPMSCQASDLRVLYVLRRLT